MGSEVTSKNHFKANLVAANRTSQPLRIQAEAGKFPKYVGVHHTSWTAGHSSPDVQESYFFRGFTFKHHWFQS